mgnify:CR=1 FL=1
MKVWDLHCDTLYELRRAEKAGAPKSFLHNDLHIDLEKLQQGDYLLQCFAAYVDLADPAPGADPLVSVLEEIDIFKRLMAAYPEKIAPVYTAADLERNRAEGKFSAMLTVEEGGCCKGSLGVLRRLPEPFRSREISLQNGTIFDCRGCSYDACLHFAEQNRCFYGGAITEEVLPAVQESDALLLLCPNFNDAVSANITAFFNRLTNLLVLRDLSEKYVFAIVVSGYSGSDLVARQILGAMSMNKGAILPPQFCLMQTANDPGSAQKSEGIAGRLDTFAAHIAQTLLP